MRSFICKMNFEEKRRRDMDQLPRHVKRAFYCEECDRSIQLDIWIDTIGLTSTNITYSY